VRRRGRGPLGGEAATARGRSQEARAFFAPGNPAIARQALLISIRACAAALALIGIADVLLERAVADAGQAGHRAIVLGTNRGNKGAQAFYKRHGFRKRSTRTFDVGGVINYDVVMVRDLTTPVE